MGTRKPGQWKGKNVDTHTTRNNDTKTKLAALAWELNTTKSRVLTALEALRGARDMLTSLEQQIQDLADAQDTTTATEPRDKLHPTEDTDRPEATTEALLTMIREWCPTLPDKIVSADYITRAAFDGHRNPKGEIFPKALKLWWDARLGHDVAIWDVEAVLDWYESFV